MVRQGFFGVGAALLALMLAVRLNDGSMGFLVQSWYLPILFATAGAFMLLATVVSVQTVRQGGRWRPTVTARSLAGAALIAAPLLLGLALHPRPLGANTLDASNARAGTVRQFAQPAAAADPAQRNIYQWAYELQSTDPKQLIGQPVDVTGFVYHGKADLPGTFQVARFVVACCVADATGTSLPVQWAGADGLANNGWVHVQGHVITRPGGSVLVQASSVDLVEAPSNPYIYP